MTAPGEGTWRELLHHLMETVSVLDATGRVLFTSRDSTGVLGYPPGSMPGRSMWDLAHPDDIGALAERWAYAVAHPGEEVSGQFRALGADGTWQVLEGIATNLLHEPAVGGIVMSTRNVTDRVRAQERAEASEQRLRALIAHAADAVMVVGAGGRCTFASPAITRLTGYTPGELVDLNVLTGLLDEDELPVARAAFQSARASTEPVRAELRIRHVGGTSRVIQAVFTNLLADPHVQGVVINVADITDRRRGEEALRHLALHDPLTGLPNRTLLADRASRAVERARRFGAGVAVLFCDLDRFKVVNDSLGHAAGDVVLQEVARRLPDVVRPGDTVARLGGDEFVVLCEGVTAEHEAVAVAERIARVVAEPISLPGGPLVVEASIGIVLSAEGDDDHDLLRDADTAMYVAKEQGRGRAVLFEPSLRSRSFRRLSVEAGLRRALADDGIVVHYQPVVHLASGRVEGVEALVRWLDPERGLVTPAEFLGVAEESGLIAAIGERVLATACADASRWRTRHPDLRVWVNLSPRELAQPSLAERVVATARLRGLPPSALGIEITEGALLGDPSAVLANLEAMRGHGISVALDDFGTGYSSLSWLKRLPVDVVKVPREFVADLDEGPDPVVAAVAALGTALGLGVVAEGVETSLQLRRAAALGCTAAQGWYLARPKPAAEVALGQMFG